MKLKSTRRIFNLLHFLDELLKRKTFIRSLKHNSSIDRKIEGRLVNS